MEAVVVIAALAGLAGLGYVTYMQNMFNVEAFKNSALDTNGIMDFLPGLTVADAFEAHDDPDVNVLLFRDKSGAVDWSLAYRIQVSSWHYNRLTR